MSPHAISGRYRTISNSKQVVRFIRATWILAVLVGAGCAGSPNIPSGPAGPIEGDGTRYYDDVLVTGVERLRVEMADGNILSVGDSGDSVCILIIQSSSFHETCPLNESVITTVDGSQWLISDDPRHFVALLINNTVKPDGEAGITFAGVEQANLHVDEDGWAIHLSGESVPSTIFLWSESGGSATHQLPLELVGQQFEHLTIMSR